MEGLGFFGRLRCIAARSTWHDSGASFEADVSAGLGFAVGRITVWRRGRRMVRRAELVRLTKCGAHCRTLGLIPPGQPVAISLLTPLRRWVECEGTVVSSRKGTAVSFAAIVFTAIRGQGEAELRQRLTDLSRSRCSVVV